MTPLTKRLSEIRSRVAANSKYSSDLQIELKSKIDMIAQTGALKMTLDDRLDDANFLLSALERAVGALELYASCPVDTGIPERIINGGEYIGLGTTARQTLSDLNDMAKDG